MAEDVFFGLSLDADAQRKLVMLAASLAAAIEGVHGQGTLSMRSWKCTLRKR